MLIIGKKLTETQLSFVYGLQERLKRENDWREGQSFYNALFMLYPETALEINGTELDPFDNDEKLIDCIKGITQFNPQDN